MRSATCHPRQLWLTCDANRTCHGDRRLWVLRRVRHHAVRVGVVRLMVNWAKERKYFGSFTRDQAEGAWPNGTRVVKAKGDPGGSDTTANGMTGVVLGSIRMPEINDDVFYFIEWDDKPLIAIG